MQSSDPGRAPHTHLCCPGASKSSLVLLQVRAGRAASHTGGQSSARSNVTHISPYLPHLARLSQPRLQPGLLLEGREGLPSPAGQILLRRRHCPAAVLIGPSRATGRYAATRLTCRMPALMPSSPHRRHTHTHTQCQGATFTTTPPPGGGPRWLLEAPQSHQHNAGYDIKPVFQNGLPTAERSPARDRAGVASPMVPSCF